MIDGTWQTASLRIFSEKLDSSEITEILDRAPTRYTKKGELMSPRNPKSQRYDHNLWLLESNLEDSTIYDEHINYLLSFVEAKKKEITILKEKCVIDIVCALSIDGTQASFDLNPEIINRLSAAQLGIVFDLYVNS